MFNSIKSEQKKIYSKSLFETDNSSKTKKIKFCTYSPLAPTFLLKKKFNVIKSKKHKNKDTLNEYISHGYWDRNEHNKFIDALYLYNCKWLKIEAYIKNRSYKQIRSHAQKFYVKLKSYKDEELGLDFTSPKVKSLKNIIEIIKEKEINEKNCGKLLQIISDKISFGKNVHRENLDEKHNEEDFEEKKEVQSQKCENSNVNANNRSNNKNSINIKKSNSEDLFVETLDKKFRNHTSDSDLIEYNILFSSFIETDYDNNYIFNSDIRKDPIFIQTIFS